MKDDTNKENKSSSNDANTCMALGTGVGLLGATTAALTGALCPLCIIVAPGLVGLGAYKKWKCGKMN